MLPKDPVILLSYINTQLRDYYDSFDELCKSLCEDPEEISTKLSKIGYKYYEETNQFR